MAEPLLTSPTLLTSTTLLTSAGIPDIPPGTGTSGRFALRATISTAGPCGVSIPHALPIHAAATISFALRLSDRPSTVTVSVTYANAAGAALTPVTATLSANEVNKSVDRFDRQTVHVTAPNGAATVGTIKVVVDPLPVGGYLDLDAILIERGYTDGAYFDGDNLGGQWLGTPELSASVLAPIVEVADGECPLDVAVTYQLANPSVAGGRMTSQPATLDSNGKTWLTHPALPAEPIVVDLRKTPVLVRKVQQGIFQPIGRRYPVVKSAAQRQATSGQVDFNADGWATRDKLLELFDDLSPVLVRAPGDHGMQPMWLALGDLTEDPENRKGWQDARLLSAPFVEVDAPAA